MRANAEALFQDILGKPLSSSFKNTQNPPGKKKDSATSLKVKFEGEEIVVTRRAPTC